MTLATLFLASVSMTSLLRDMTVRDALTYYPSEPRKLRLWSSADRATVGKVERGWFANCDKNAFLRSETNAAGQVEHVMVDAQGPGALVRAWVTVAEIPDGGLLRLYVDGALVCEGKTFDILSGSALCGAPLADSLSKLTPLSERGHDLYLPIPFAKRLKVTVAYPRGGPDQAFFYNFETLAFPSWMEGEVESFSNAALLNARTAIDAANERLRQGTEDPLPDGTVRKTLRDFTLAPGESKTLSFGGTGALREIALELDEADWWTPGVALPSDLTVVLMFDGLKTVEMPASMFFGNGCVREAYGTHFCSGCGSRMKVRWTMPFRRDAHVTLRADGRETFRFKSLSVAHGPYRWDGLRSMLFAAHYVPRHDIRTRGEDGDHRDVNFLTFGGKGVFVGCGVRVLNTAYHWWGEGDEKVFVDGEPFPSLLGTGSEDHFGYAWGRGECFSHPFLAQPEGGGAQRPGQVVNLRHRVLDAIPFERSIVFDMELWHWRDCRIDYDTVAWYYFRPTDACAAKDDPARPQLHATVKNGWVNDPNGLVRWKDEWHYFCQHNPYGVDWGNMHWCHLVSKDLLHWEELGDVLKPDELGTMFSGSAVTDRDNTAGFGAGALVLAYTAAGRRCTQCLAYSTDGRHFAKYDGNPVLEQISPSNRDPKVFWHEPTKRWIMVLFGDNLPKFVVWIYASSDLKHWTKLSEFEGVSRNEPRETWWPYECPGLEELKIEGETGTAWVLWGATHGYAVGSFDGTTFKPFQKEPLESYVNRVTVDGKRQESNPYYAAQTFSDVPDGRKIWSAWLRLPYADGATFHHAFSLPHELSLVRTASGLRMVRRPAQELRGLREGDRVKLADFDGELAEISLSCALTADGRLGLDLRGVPFVYDARAGVLRFGCEEVPWRLSSGRLALTLFLDRVSAEVFSDDGLQTVPFVLARPDPNARHLRVVSERGVTEATYSAYRLKSIHE